MSRSPLPAPAQGSTLAASDAAALERLAAGDLDALGKLYDRYERDVRRFVARLGVSEADADDLVQATFLDVARGAARFDAAHAGERGARSWILGIAAMMVRRHRRSVARLVRGFAAHIFEGRRPQPIDPSAAFEDEESQLRFRHALDRLSTKKREVFVMITMEGASGDQVAAALGIPVATVWTRLHHARKELRAALFDEPNDAQPSKPRGTS
jgi:RNA polymerase sigma-70 factor (ECF subfamily)